MTDRRQFSRREFAGAGALIGAALTLSPVSKIALGAQQPQGRGGGRAAGPAVPAPETLKSERLMDMILETSPAATVGSRQAVPFTGTFEGPKLKGTIAAPSTDWPFRGPENVRFLDGRMILVTDDEQRIYCSYRGVIYTPPAGEGDRYWRSVPVFETDSKKYEWLNHIVAVGVSYTVPQRIAYRVFQIL